jgi:hypothetical protein
LPSSGSLQIKVNGDNTVDLIFGDFAIVHPDLCFEGFGSLRPSVTYKDEKDSFNTWFIYGDPTAPTIDTLSDTAFSNLPIIGQKITLNFNKTNFIKRIANSAILVYPNPAIDVLNINGVTNIEDGHFQIFSMEGRTINKGKITNNQINIEQLKTGNYVLKVQSNGRVFYSKFIKIDN